MMLPDREDDTSAPQKLLKKYLMKGMACDSEKWLREFDEFQKQGGAITPSLVQYAANHEFSLLVKTDAVDLQKLDAYLDVDGATFKRLREQGIEKDEDEVHSHSPLTAHTHCILHFPLGLGQTFLHTPGH